MTPRVRNWDVALVAWANAQAGEPYRWGATDCASLVRQAATILFGRDPWPDVRYDTALDAARVLVARGPVSAHLEAIGARPVAPRFAQSGDVLILPDDAQRELVSLVVADAILEATPERGVQLLPRRIPPAAIAWRLPEALP